MMGTPIIMPKVTRSRRIWMNSFTSTALNRASEKMFMPPPRHDRAVRNCRPLPP